MTHLQMLVSRHQAKATRTVDWSKRKDKWLEMLDRLNRQIRDALLAAGVPAEQIQATNHTINEETLGQYEAEGLLVKIGTDTVTFTPVASVIIGGYGRVDVAGPYGEAKLIAEDAEAFPEIEDKAPSKERERIWSVYPDKSRRGSFRLDDEGLAKVLEQVLR